MTYNDFEMDSHKAETKGFSRRVRALLIGSIFLTGIFLISRGCYLGLHIINKSSSEIRATHFAWQILLFISVFCCFISLIKIARDKKPFSKVLAYCMWVIGGIFTVAAVVFPRLPGYQSSGVEFFSRGDFVFLDGAVLLPGLLLIVFGILIKEGLQMQKEIEEIL